MTNILYFICYCITGFMVFDFLKMAFGKKHNKNLYYFTSYVIFVAGYMYVGRFHNMLINVTVGTTVAVIVSLILYQDHAKKSVYIFLFMCYLTLFDTLGTLIGASLRSLKFVNYGNDFNGVLASVITAQTLMLCTYRLIGKKLIKKSFDSVTKKESIFQFLFLLFQVVAIFLSVYSLKDNATSFFLFFLSVGFIGADIYIIYLFQNLSEHNLLKERQSLELQQQLMLNQHYNELDEKFGQYRGFMHDIKEHKQTITGLHEAGEIEIEESYKEELAKYKDILGQRFYCKNRILMVIINDVKERALIKKIPFIYKIQDLELSFLENIDITTIMCNILNNALTACEAITDNNNWIKLNIHEVNQNVVIYAANSCKLKSQKIEAGKSSKLGHTGIGLTNIRGTVEKYHGIFDVSCKDYIFEVKISIPYQNLRN